MLIAINHTKGNIFWNILTAPEEACSTLSELVKLLRDLFIRCLRNKREGKVTIYAIIILIKILLEGVYGIQKRKN